MKRGGCFPVGGGNAIVNALVDIIEQNGGELRTRFDVDKVLVEKGRAVGVSGTNGEALYSDVVIINIGIKDTVSRLLRPHQLPKAYREKMLQYAVSKSNLCLFVGLEGDITEVEAEPLNYRIYRRELFDEVGDPCLPDWEPNVATVMFQSLRDKNKRDGKYHTCEILIPTPYDYFSNWAKQKVKKRDKAYKEMKETVSKKMLKVLTDRFPGIDEYVKYWELGTPVTYEYYCRHQNGATMGMQNTPGKFHDVDIRLASPLKNLFYAGADVFSCGIMGSFMSGIAAASLVTGKNLFTRLR